MTMGEALVMASKAGKAYQQSKDDAEMLTTARNFMKLVIAKLRADGFEDLIKIYLDNNCQ